MAENRVIKEIVCIKSIVQETGKPRVLKPTDFEDGLHWERQVEAAMGDPASYEIHRETVYAEVDEAQDLSAIDVKDMMSMSRERVSEIAVKAYGIKDEGQTRSTLIDQIVGEKEKQDDILHRFQTAGEALGDASDD